MLCFSQRSLASSSQFYVFGHIHAARGTEHLAWNATQAAYVYEDVRAGRSRWTGLLKMLWYVAVSIIREWLPGDSGSPPEGTTLVNAAAVGGMIDEKTLGAVIIDV